MTNCDRKLTSNLHKWQNYTLSTEKLYAYSMAIKNVT